MPILEHTIGWLAQAPGPSPAPGTAGRAVGGATILLAVAVGGAIVLMFLIARLGRRWALHDSEPDRPRENHRSRVDPWFEAGRRIQAPADDQEPRP